MHDEIADKIVLTINAFHLQNIVSEMNSVAIVYYIIHYLPRHVMLMFKRFTF